MRPRRMPPLLNRAVPGFIRMPTWTTRPSLLHRVRNPADDAAWRDFDRQYGELILRYCRRRGLPFCEAEDIRQMVLLGLSRAMATFEYDPARGRFRAYLGRAVRNAISRHAARHTVAAQGLFTDVGDDFACDAAADTDQQWDHEWALHHCRRAMHTLRATTDSVALGVFDRLLAGEDTAQVAARFNTSAAAVRKIKQRVRERLSALIARQVRDEDTGPHRDSTC